MSRTGSLPVHDRGSPRGLSALTIVSALVIVFSSCPAQDWEVEWVDYARDFDQLTSRCLGIDGLGGLHVAYGEDHLYYAHFEGSAWLIEVADSSCWSVESASIAVDQQGRPHVAYKDAVHGDLKYARRTESRWEHCVVDTLGDVGSYCCIVIDPTGLPQIAYYDATSADLKFAHKTGMAWSTEVIDGTGSVGTDLSFAISPAGLWSFAHLMGEPVW